MKSEPPPLTSPAEDSGQRDLSGIINDSRRRQLTIFRRRQAELDAYSDDKGASGPPT